MDFLSGVLAYFRELATLTVTRKHEGSLWGVPSAFEGDRTAYCLHNVT